MAVIRSARIKTILCGLLMSIGCKDAGPSLDEVLARFIELRNEQSDITCMCPSLVVDFTDPEGDVFASEEECLAAWDELSEEHAACMKSVLEAALETEKAVSLVQCYNTVTQTNIDCKAQNTECSDVENNRCFDQAWAASNQCGASYSEELTEAFFLCAYP